MKVSARYDVVVIGAGVFGAWTAYTLRLAGKHVALLDAYGPGNSRASSGGESRIIRMGYGGDRLYTRYSLCSLELWKALFGRTGQDLFHRTGMLWMAGKREGLLQQTANALRAERVMYEELSARELKKRFPQFSFKGVSAGLYEPESGALLARRAVQAVVNQAVTQGVEYFPEAFTKIHGKRRIESVSTAARELAAENFVFAGGPWLPKLFPRLLKKRITPTRQEVFFFGAGAEQASLFAPPAMPCFYHHDHEIYGVPNLENRGVKVASDRLGPKFDPDSGSRVVSERGTHEIRGYLRRYIPLLAKAPIVESRVCQYESTPNRDFLIDRHPELENAWIVGGGSGHGFKHGPAVGEYVTGLLLGRGVSEPRFALAAHSLR
jgi:sarcosine oxidase